MSFRSELGTKLDQCWRRSYTAHWYIEHIRRAHSFLELWNPLHDVSEQHKIRQFAGFEALKLWNCSSGSRQWRMSLKKINCVHFCTGPKVRRMEQYSQIAPRPSFLEPALEMDSQTIVLAPVSWNQHYRLRVHLKCWPITTVDPHILWPTLIKHFTLSELNRYHIPPQNQLNPYFVLSNLQYTIEVPLYVPLAIIPP